MPTRLTPKQASFLAYVERILRERGVLPTYRQMMDHFGFASPNSVTQNFAALERKGYVCRTADGWRLTRSTLARRREAR